MGSKNLKAVAVRGTLKPDLADKEAFKALVSQGAKDFPTSMISGMGKLGTSAAVGGQQAVGGLPSYNFNSGVFDSWEKIDGTTMYKTLRRGHAEGKQQKYGQRHLFWLHCLL